MDTLGASGKVSLRSSLEDEPECHRDPSGHRERHTYVATRWLLWEREERPASVQHGKRGKLLGGVSSRAQTVPGPVGHGKEVACCSKGNQKRLKVYTGSCMI